MTQPPTVAEVTRFTLSLSLSFALPRALQRQLLVALAQHRAKLKALLQAVQAARDDAVLTAEAQPFDRIRTEAALEDLRCAADALMQAAQGIALDSLAAKSGGQAMG